MPKTPTKLDQTRAEKLKTISDFLKLNEDAVTRKEFVKYYQGLVETIVTLRKKNAKELQEILAELKTAFKEYKGDTSNAIQNKQQDLINTVTKATRDLENRHKELEQKLLDVVSNIQDGKDADEEYIVEEVLRRVPKPEIKEETGDQVIDKINDAQNLIEKERVEGLDELIRRVESWGRKPLFGRGGGTSDIGVVASLGRQVKTETPTGDIDGVNTTYTVNATINSVFSFAINGMTIHSSEYTTSGNTITFTTALPAALSGTSFEIVYV